MKPIAVTFAMTHPIQYYSPWFRFIQGRCPDLDLTVVYATVPTADQQGVGFGVSFEWDTSPLEGYKYKVVRSAQSDDYLHSDRFFGLDAPGIAQLVFDTHADAVVVPGWYSLALARVLGACRLRGTPAIYRGDSQPPMDRSALNVGLWRSKNKTMLALFDAYMTVGQRNREYLKSFEIPDERIFFAPHCVDNELFARTARSERNADGTFPARIEIGATANDFVVLFVGKLEDKKRPEDVIAASARLGEGVTVVIAGAGPRESNCRALAYRLGSRVVFAGFVNQSRIGRLYAAADVCVLPSASEAETWGLVVNEALAAGTPCIVSDHVGCGPDLIRSGVTGEVFAACDIDGLAGALGRLRDAKRAGHDFTAACRQLVAEYSYERATDGLLAACRYVVANKNS